MNGPTFQAPSTDRMNRLLPAFGFTALVASNDQSAVYAATQKSLDRNVGIKVLSPEVSGHPDFRKSFETTARTMARLNHPNLIGVFDSGYVDEMLYFVMEFIPGKSLERSSSGQCVEPAQALKLIEGISKGLAHAHDHGVVHGCVEPSVILLNQKAEPKIGNFGFNYPAGAERNAFLAPELGDSGAVADFRADIFAVGAILYQLITGHPHREGAPAPSTLVRCDSKIDEIWRKATDPDPLARYAGMRALQKEVSAMIQPVRRGRAVSSPVTRGLAVGVSPKPGSAGGAPPLTSPQPAMVHHVGVNWILIRNLFIIAGLSYAIYLAWGGYQDKVARTDRENREMEAKVAAEKAKAIEDAKNRKLTNRPPDRPVVVPDIPDRPTPRVETPAQSLSRLRSALVAGDRSEMPVGSVAQGESHFFLVEQMMSWPDAAVFAERHGAHLAVPAVGANLTWLVANVTLKKDVWIGAARSGQRAWTLADGKAWKPSKEPSGTGTYVGIDKAGFLRAASAKVLLPFVMQWHSDGKNPGSLENLLSVTRSSLAGGNPVYPPGTQALDGRSFLYVARRTGWDEAVRLAEQGGGVLAVPSSTAEIAFLSDISADITANEGIWLGGFLQGDAWTWITGEPWKSAKWVTGATNDEPDSALRILPGKGWNGYPKNDDAAGLWIEWSADAKSKSSTSGTADPGKSTPGLDVDALLLKAKSLIEAADRKRGDQLEANARKFAADLDLHLRSLPRGAQETWKPEVDKINACIKDSRVPVMIPQDSGIKINTAMDAIVRYGAKKQQEYDDEFIAAAENLQTAFIAKLRDSLQQARQAGQTLMVASLENSLGEIENLDSWVRSLGVEPRPENPVPKKEKAWKGNKGRNNGEPKKNDKNPLSDGFIE